MRCNMEYELTNIIYDNSEYELEIENENTFSMF